MLTGLDHEGKLVVASDISRQDGPWSCPGCSAPVRYRSGPLTIAHFAHLPGGGPEWCDRVAESLEHERTKLAIFEAARKTPGVTFTQPEFRIGCRVADVVIMAGDRKIAIEVQRSPVSDEELESRTANHQDHGFSVMWVLSQPEDWAPDNTRHRTKAFQRYIHDEINWGWFFVHDSGLKFYCVHLMGYTANIKHFKRNYYPTYLFDSEDSAGLVFPSVKDRWWEQLKPRSPYAGYR